MQSQAKTSYSSSLSVEEACKVGLREGEASAYALMCAGVAGGVCTSAMSCFYKPSGMG